MSPRSVVPQVALALLGLVAAFLVWRREPEALPGDVPVVDVSRGELLSVRYEDAEGSVTLHREGESIWVRVGGARELRGNALARSLMASFAPLEGLRALGVLDAEKLEELGISGSPRRLALAVEGREHVLTLAAPVGTDWGSPYALREDGRVFLLGPTLLQDLEAAEARLVDRRMHALAQGDIETFTVTQGATTREFSVSGELLAAEKGTPDERVRQWHERVWQLMPLEVLGRGESPPGGEPEALFQVEYRRSGRVVGHAAIARGAEGDFFARTEHTAGWVRLEGEVETLAAEALAVASATGSP